MAPLAAGLKIDDLERAFAVGNLEAQGEVGVGHDGDLADEHQAVFGDVAQVANGFVGDAVENLEEIRQLMPLNPAVSEHTQARPTKAIKHGHTNASERARAGRRALLGRGAPAAQGPALTAAAPK